MITTPIFTRLLSLEQYGQTANFYSWYDLLYPFVTMYLSGVAYNNVLVKYEDKRDEATFSLMTLASVVTFFFFVVYVLFSDFWNELFGINTFMMIFMFIYLLFVPIVDFWSAKERYDYKYKKLVALTFFNSFFSLFISVLLVMNIDYKYEARVLPNIIITALIGLIIYYSYFKKNSFKFTAKYWKYALIISLPLIPHYLSIKILNQVDRVMITKLVGLSETGLYSLAYTIACLMIIFTDAINRSLCPYIYKSIKNNNVDGVSKVINSVSVLVMAVSFLEMLLAPELIRVFATTEYLDAVFIIPPVAMSVFFIFLYVVYSNVEFYYEKTVFATVVSVVAALCNIILNYIFIPIWGYYAAGFTTLLCYMLFAVLHYMNYKKIVQNHIELSDLYDNRFILIICIIGILLIPACLILYEYNIIRYILIGIICIVSIIKSKAIVKVLKIK